jgi:hypothetical protein
MDKSLHSFIKKAMAIPLLHPDKMDDAFEYLRGKVAKLKNLARYKLQLNRFFFYFGKQWLSQDIRSMVSFHNAIYRTNNFSEGTFSSFTLSVGKDDPRALTTLLFFFCLLRL